jgi:short-subunit dehydrogenase
MVSETTKVVVITGASSGIGKALADLYLSKGYKVAICARNYEKLVNAFSSFNEEQLLLKAVDVSNEDACQDFITDIKSKWGRIDILINNAGISMRALFEHVDLKVLHELMNINFWGTVNITKAVLSTIISNKGVIVGVSSIAGYRGLPARTGYSASKFAMQGFLESLKTELLQTGVHVMWVSPGFTASNIRNTALGASGVAQKESPLKEEKLMSAEECASEIFSSIEKRKRTLVLTLQGKLAVLLNKLLPSFVDKKTYNLFLAEPESPLKNYHR